MVAVMKAFGAYSAMVPQKVWFVLNMHVETSTRLTADLIKLYVRPDWPKNKSITSTEVWNICLKVNTLLPLNQSTGDYGLFKLSAPISSLLGGFDDQDDITDNMGYIFAHEVCTAVLEQGNSGEHIFLSFNTWN